MIEIYIGHRIAQNKHQDIGPYQQWHIDPTILDRVFSKCENYKKFNKMQFAKDAALSESNYILLTVDDGFNNFSQEVLPLLEKYQIGCIIFLTTGFIDRRLIPYELEIAEIVNNYNIVQLPKNIKCRLSSSSTKQDLYEQLRLAVKTKNNYERQKFIEDIKHSNIVSDKYCRPDIFLNWNDIIQLDRHPLITFGAHTETHPYLPTISWIEAYSEIRNSKKRIESKLGHPIQCFSYPYGGVSLWLQFIVWMTGFKYAFTTEHRVARAERFNRFALPRLDLQKFITTTDSL